MANEAGILQDTGLLLSQDGHFLSGCNYNFTPLSILILK